MSTTLAPPLPARHTDGTLGSSTIARLNLKLIPFLMLLYLIAYIDRANISVAALRMNADLGLTTRMYGIAVGLFYVTYVLLEVPSNLILSHVGARRWIARIMVSWGLVAAGMSLVQTPMQLYIMRLLLGAAEAGFTPGIIYYLSCWYPRSDRARAMSFFYIGATLASVIGLPLSGTLLKLDGVMGVSGWRWLFLLEGLPAVALAGVVLWYLPDVPAKAPWLSAAQKDWLIGLLRKEADSSPVSHSTAWQKALRNGRVWLLALFWFLQAFATLGITVFLPLIVRSVSTESDLMVTVLSAVPFLFACVFMYTNGRHSDRSGERRFHLGAPLLMAGTLMIASIYSGNQTIAYALLVVTIALSWAATPVFWAVTTEYLSGTAAAVSIALINGIANICGVALPPLMGYIKDTTGSYDYALLLVAGALLCGGALGLYLGPLTARTKSLL
jgi:MFS transporter, ACS family, tartrate transporter